MMDSRWSIDVAPAGLHIHLGDVASAAEAVAAQVVCPAIFGLAGFFAHAVLVKLHRSTVWKAMWVIFVGTAAAAFPFAVLAICPVASRLTGFVLSYQSVLGFFRWLELVMGRGPKGSAATSLVYAAYFCCPCEILFEDGKMRKVSSRRTALKELVKESVWHGLLFLVVNSIGQATAFLPFLEIDDFPASLSWYGLLRTLPGLYLQTYMVYCMMALTMTCHRAVVALLGLETLVTFKLPLLLSTSLREFWGRRWNLLIHNLMKRCFFDPFRDGPAWQKSLGGLLAFAMSGLFHEYMWLVLHASRPNQSKYVAGKVLLFFLAQFVATALQAVLSKGPLGRIVATVPDPVLTLLVTLAVLPLSPLFLEGVYDMLCELPDILPAVQIKDGMGLFLRSAVTCFAAVGPVAFLMRQFARQSS